MNINVVRLVSVGVFPSFSVMCKIFMRVITMFEYDVYINSTSMTYYQSSWYVWKKQLSSFRDMRGWNQWLITIHINNYHTSVLSIWIYFMALSDDSLCVFIVYSYAHSLKFKFSWDQISCHIYRTNYCS